MSSALEERKLRVVYELLDEGAPRLALAELEKHIKRSSPSSGTSPLVSAVKCLCLQRNGENAEAMEVFVEMVKREKDRIEADALEKQKLIASAATKDDKEAKKPKPKAKGKGKGKGKGKSGKGHQPLEKDDEADNWVDGPEGTPEDAADQVAFEHSTDISVVDDMEITIERDDLVGKVVFDDRVLSCLAYALKPMREYRHLRCLHLNAWLAAPTLLNLPNAEQYFMYCIRLGDWAGGYEIASGLYLHEDPRLKQWAAMCLYLQTTDHGSEKDTTKQDGPSSTEQSRWKETLRNSLMLISDAFPPPYDQSEALLVYLRMNKDLSASLKDRPAETDLSTTEDRAAWEAEGVEVLQSEKRVLEVLTKGSIQIEDTNSDPTKAHEAAEVARNKVMKDLRFKWAYWELVETAAKREAKLARSTGSETEEDDGTSNGGELKERVIWEWDWRKEWERLDKAIRGAEDLPETNYKAFICYVAVLDVVLAENKELDGRDASSYLQATRETLRSMTDRYGSRESAPLLSLIAISYMTSTKSSEGEEDRGERGDRKDLCEQYLASFGHKASAFAQVKEYWPCGGDPADDWGRATLAAACSVEPKNLDDYNRRLTAEKLKRYVSPVADSEEEKRSAATYWKLYTAGAVYGKDLPMTDVCPADDFSLLAVQAVICAATNAKLGRKEDSFGLLLLAVLLLEKIIRVSPSSALARVLLLRFNRLLGAPSLVMLQVEPLKMRHFQQDTVLHMVTERGHAIAMASGDKSRIAQLKLLSACQETYHETDHEITEGVVASFNNGTLSQVTPMLDLQRDLRFSVQQEIIKLELVRQSASKGTSIPPGVRPINPSNLRDVRDWDLLPDYGSKASSTHIREQTASGPCTSAACVIALRSAWCDIADMHRDTETSGGQDAGHTDVSDSTAAERALITFATNLVESGKAWKQGSMSSVDLQASFAAILASEEPETWGGWQESHRWTTLIEAWTMYEVVIGPLKPVKKAKKAAKTELSPVEQAIKLTTTGLQSVLKGAIEQAKASLGSDPLMEEGQLAKTVDNIGLGDKALDSLVKGVETSIKDSRRIAIKELVAALNRRIES